MECGVMWITDFSMFSMVVCNTFTDLVVSKSYPSVLKEGVAAKAVIREKVYDQTHPFSSILFPTLLY